MANISHRTLWIHLMNALAFLLVSLVPLVRWEFKVFDVILLYISSALLGFSLALAFVTFGKFKEK